jgi:microcystin-dependent protein
MNPNILLGVCFLALVLSIVALVKKGKTGPRGPPGTDSSGAVPVGTIVASAASYTNSGSLPPDGWLVCDGSEQNRLTYKKLFAAIKTNWNSLADKNNPKNPIGSSGFALPYLYAYSLRGGMDPGTFGGNDNLAETSGPGLTLDLAWIPNHKHSNTAVSTQGTHSHPMTDLRDNNNEGPIRGYSNSKNAGHGDSQVLESTSEDYGNDLETDDGSSGSITTTVTGGFISTAGRANENIVAIPPDSMVAPYATVCYLIYYGTKNDQHPQVGLFRSLFN